MKKLLLAAAAVAICAPGALADSYKFVFDGENDMYGLTREMSINVSSYVKEWDFSDQGVKFSLTEAEGSTANGFALVHATGANAGIMVHSTFTTSSMPLMEMTVPGGKISGAKVWVSGYGMSTLDISFNGKAKEWTSSENSSIYLYEWSDATGVETLSFTWPKTYGSRYIHAIELIYTEDLGGKQPCGLTFSSNSAEGVMGETFTAPNLNNPNNLPIEWTSSDEAVATVNNEGIVTMIGRGTTVITAATKGNDEFAKGSVKYDLTVIPTANNILEMKTIAPNAGDRVKVLFPMTVTFAKGGYAFVIDSEDNASYIYNYKNEGETSAAGDIYSRGDIIPAGWMATNETANSSWMWRGLPEESTEKVENLPYPEVESITPADADRVLIVKNVAFDTNTPGDMNKVWGNGIEFQNSYNAPIMPPGRYNVTGVVRYSIKGSTTYFYVNTISYTECIPEFPEELVVKASDESISIEQVVDEGVIMLTVTGYATGDYAILTFDLPEGWDGIIGGIFEYGFMKKAPAEWPTIEEFRNEMGSMIEDINEGTTISLPADGKAHPGQYYLYTGNYVDVDHGILVQAEIGKSTETGITSIESEADVRYFNLQGAEVSNPENGIFVRVANGKTSKVVLK